MFKEKQEDHLSLLYIKKVDLEHLVTLMPLCQNHSNRFLKCLAIGFNWKMHFLVTCCFLATPGYIQIGGFGSSSFSMTDCIYYNFQFIFSIYDHLLFISSDFDNLHAAAVVYKSSDITSKSLVSNLSHQLQYDVSPINEIGA